MAQIVLSVSAVSNAQGSCWTCLLFGLLLSAGCTSNFEPPTSGGECSASRPCDTGTCDVRSGSCVADEQTIAVASSGAAEPGCGDAVALQPPCNTISAGIRRAIALGRSTVAIEPGDQFTESLEITTPFPLRVIGFGASLQNDGAFAEHVFVSAGSSVEISGLSFEGLGVDNQGIAVVEGATLSLYKVSIAGYGRDGVIVNGTTELADQTVLAIESATIANNGSLSDSASAIAINQAAFSIRNSAIVDNHVAGVTFGLASVSTPISFELNTVMNNGDPFYCGTAEPDLEFSFVGNIVDDGAECPSGIFEHSWVPTDTLGSNLARRPTFAGAGSGDYRLASESTGIDVFELGAISRAGDTDADGVTRPRGAAPDIGAYER